ncbi:MAG: protein kinase [Synechococcales cyanobacterium C42_A2020_086]|jgi:serine/threonine-protein kinase|nr:protein kinase [Synechococcales cyanobacterium M58_A2018_015]MBF2076887.1 protein kinase [Synechococcales cyanobacterium C42_A2020_086]
MLGTILDGRYRVVEGLSAGGFGSTYIVEDTRRPGNPQCVLKVLKTANSNPEYLAIARRLFNSEAETLEQLGNHDQIPRLLAYFEADGQFYLVQELIVGQSLAAELSPGQRWSEGQVRELLQDVLQVLDFVHRCGVIHRDIKPANLIRRQSDRKLVLIDFGAVKQMQTQLASAADLTAMTVAIGTPGYMPAEQAQGKPRPNSDLYALGVIAIQALTGRLPSQLPEDSASGELAWQPYAVVSPELADVLEKMVRYHHRDRYQSVGEVLRDLQLLDSLATPAAVPLPSTQMLFNAADPYSVPFAATSPSASVSNPSLVDTTSVARLNRILAVARFAPFVGALGVMLSDGQTWITLLAVALISAGAGLFGLRSLYPPLARDYDASFTVILALAGILLLFQDEYIKTPIKFAEFLLTGAAFFAISETIRLRSMLLRPAARQSSGQSSGQ